MNYKTLLDEEIKSEFGELEKLEIGSDAYVKAVDGLVKLTDRTIEIEKLEKESEEKKVQLEEDRKDRLIRHCISVAGIVLPLTVTIWGTLKSFKFEENGTITTIMGRGFINKLLPKK